MIPIDSKHEIVPSRSLDPWTPARVARAFQTLVEAGMTLRVAGAARRRPKRVLELGYTPRYHFELFGTRFFVSVVRQNPELRFCVVWVVQPRRRGRGLEAFARIFYKDLSLVWRAASHVAYDAWGSLWIGKGDVREVRSGDYLLIESVESTTDLPLEIQTALETCSRRTRKTRADAKILPEVLRRASPSRVVPFAEFTAPRRRAAADPRTRIHGGRKIARFRRRGDPSSLEFVEGYEPDFAHGILEIDRTKSHLYHGIVRRHRILSTNRRIQYLFLAAPRHVWIIPPQALTTELSSFGLRLVDVVADEDLFIPGYEYHYVDPDAEPPALYSQIPKGYAGGPCEGDPNKADASPWLEALPVIQRFRREVLGRRPRPRWKTPRSTGAPPTSRSRGC